MTGTDRYCQPIGDLTVTASEHGHGVHQDGPTAWARPGPAAEGLSDPLNLPSLTDIAPAPAPSSRAPSRWTAMPNVPTRNMQRRARRRRLFGFGGEVATHPGSAFRVGAMRAGFGPQGLALAHKM